MAAESWSDTEISVRVPAEAGCGPISLEIVAGTVCACDACIDFHRPGSSTIRVEAGPPVIFEFEVAGEGDDATVCPGEPLTLGWRLCNADRVRIMRTSDAGPELDVVDPPGEAISLGPAPAAGVETTYELVAENRCGAERRTVSMEVCSASLALATVGLDPDSIVTPASGPVTVRVPPDGELRLTATARDACGIRSVEIRGGFAQECVRGELGRMLFSDYSAFERDRDGAVELPVTLTVDLDRVNRCPEDFRLAAISGSFVAVAESNCGSLTTATLAIEFT